MLKERKDNRVTNYKSDSNTDEKDLECILKNYKVKKQLEHTNIDLMDESNSK